MPSIVPPTPSSPEIPDPSTLSDEQLSIISKSDSELLSELFSSSPKSLSIEELMSIEVSPSTPASPPPQQSSPPQPSTPPSTPSSELPDPPYNSDGTTCGPSGSDPDPDESP